VTLLVDECVERRSRSFEPVRREHAADRRDEQRVERRQVGNGRGAKLHDRDDRSEQLENDEAERCDNEPQRGEHNQRDDEPAGH
jgi:hypothetical protein